MRSRNADSATSLDLQRRGQAGRPVPLRSVRCDGAADRSGGENVTSVPPGPRPSARRLAARRHPCERAAEESMVNQPHLELGADVVRRGHGGADLELSRCSTGVHVHCARRQLEDARRERSRARAQVEPHRRAIGEPKRHTSTSHRSRSIHPCARRRCGESRVSRPNSRCRSTRGGVAVDPFDDGHHLDRLARAPIDANGAVHDHDEQQPPPRGQRSPSTLACEWLSGGWRPASEGGRPLARVPCARRTRTAAGRPGATGAPCDARPRRRLVAPDRS